jgi:hypothetical protein
MKTKVVFDVDGRVIINEFESIDAATSFYDELVERHGIHKVTLIGAGGGIMREKKRLEE